MVAVQLEQLQYSVGEEEGFVTICVLLTNATERSVQISYSTVPGSAQGKNQSKLLIL